MANDPDHDELVHGRRRFLGYSAAAIATVATVGAACTDDSRAALGAGSDGGAYDGPKGDALIFEHGLCVSGPTGDDALGPYWTRNVPRTIQIAGPEVPGRRLFVVGHVYASDCATPIPGADIVVWQADDEGLYDYNHAGLHQGIGARELTEAETRLRGALRTSVAGTYAFETIFPREYPLNLLDPASSAYRAPHIHFAVAFADNTGARHQLVTQMYFAANALVRDHIPLIDTLNAADGGVRSAEASRVITLHGGPRDLWHGQFDVVLDVDPARV